MVTLRKRNRTQETPANPKQTQDHGSTPADEVSGYEEAREKRIRENMERMQKLGILDLSLKLKSELIPPKRHGGGNSSYQRKTPKSSPLCPSLPPRRSSRLQNAIPISYSEIRPKKRGKSDEDDAGPLVGDGSVPEIYTEEHEKLLGTCEATWSLFVDGYGKDGKRIYDPVKGKTCHQCRQKTLGHRTHCCKCNLVQGQFCGDCLYMRYGEHVLEAKKNPNWVCPVCRGICNCSLCRQAKGWPATGSLYRKITSLGFKSVAHYLIQTKHSQTNSAGESSVENLVSTKRSLPFTDMEEASGHENQVDNTTPGSDDNMDEQKFESEEEAKLDCKNSAGSTANGTDNEDPLISDNLISDNNQGAQNEKEALKLQSEHGVEGSARGELNVAT